MTIFPSSLVMVSLYEIHLWSLLNLNHKRNSKQSAKEIKSATILHDWKKFNVCSVMMKRYQLDFCGTGSYKPIFIQLELEERSLALINLTFGGLCINYGQEFVFLEILLLQLIGLVGF